jgi:hypothetical protein
MVDRDEIIFKLGQLEAKMDGVKANQDITMVNIEQIKQKISNLESFKHGVLMSSSAIAMLISGAIAVFNK